MTQRLYLTSARLVDGPPEPGDLLAERIFIHASEVPEVWVETESQGVPEPGRAVTFALARPMEIGFGRIIGTIERRVEKRPPPREA